MSLRAELAEARRLNEQLAERVAAQSELLARKSERIAGVGPDEPVTANELGGQQSLSAYRSDLLPPRALLAVARVLKQGADKYGDNNWRLICRADHLNHALTHVLAELAGDAQDEHLVHAACRLLFALETT
jgi:hypothetical protein